MRWWLLTRDQARDVARQHVEQHGLPWNEPVCVSRALRGGWYVTTSSNTRGGNVFVKVTRDGKIKGGTSVAPR